MSDTPTAYVKILDKEYQVACPEGEKPALLNAAEELDKRLRAIRSGGSIVGLERIAVMAALNLCHELQQANRETSGENPEILSRINSKLDKALQENNA